MRKSVLFFAVLLCLAVASEPLLAQRGGRGRGPSGGAGGGGAGPSTAPPAERGQAGAEQGRARGGETRGRSGERTAAQHERGKRDASEMLSRNERLSSRLQPLMPDGTNVQDASAGFKNLGDFVSAVHVSRNLGIPFDDLRARVTGPDAVSLGKAVKELKPEVNSGAEVKKAKAQAKRDLKETGS